VSFAYRLALSEFCVMKKYFFLAGTLIYLFVIFPGCQVKWVEKKGEKPIVLVSVPPYVSLVKSLAGDCVEVHAAMSPGFDPHLNEITPKQAMNIQKCDLWIGIGEAYEQRLVNALRHEKKDVHILQLNDTVDLLSFAGDANSADFAFFVLPTHSSQDLHFWMSPLRLIDQARAISAALSALMPKQTALYDQKLSECIREIHSFDTKISEQLKPYAKKGLLVSHPFLGYFCHDYNLSQISVECEGKSPTAEWAQSILSLAAQRDVHCAFVSLQHPSKGACLVAERLKLKTHAIDPLGEDPLDTIQKVVDAITNTP